ALVLGHLAAVLDAQARAVRHLVGFAILAVDGHGDHDVAAHGHGVAVGGDNRRADNLDDARVGRLEEGGFRHLGRTADVEGPHRQLGARLADRLGGDDADRFADVDVGAARQVAAVAGRADAGVGFTGQGRADLDGLDAHLVDHLDFLFLQIGVRRIQDLAARLLDVLGRVTAQDALAQRDEHVAAFDHGAQGDAARRAAVFLGDDGGLRHVHQTTGQVTRVGGLQGSVGQTLTGAVGRVEVFKDGQAFLEVRDDRRLDDLARGLGHQAAHPAQLLHLSLRTTGARVGHHEDRVDVRLLTLDQDARLGDFAHHLIGDLVRGLGPGVDDLVVL